MGEFTSNTGESATLQEQIMQAKREISAAETEIKTADLKIKDNTAQLKKKQLEMKKTEAEYKRDSGSLGNFYAIILLILVCYGRSSTTHFFLYTPDLFLYVNLFAKKTLKHFLSLGPYLTVIH